MISMTWQNALYFQKTEANLGSFYNIFRHGDSSRFFLMPTDYPRYRGPKLTPVNSIKTKTFKLGIVK